MRLRLFGVFLFVMALMSSCSTDSQSTDLHLGTVQAPTSSATHVVSSTSDPMTSTSTTVRAVTAASSAVSTTIDLKSTTSPPIRSADAEGPSLSTLAETGTTVTLETSSEEEVAADYRAARGSREDCAYEPQSCAFEKIAIAGSPMDIFTRSLMADRLSKNLRAVRGRGDIKLRIEDVRLAAETAFVTICGFDTVVIFDVADPTNPGDDIIYNEEQASYRVRWELHALNGTWLLYDSVGLEDRPGGDLCAF
jgi:hypothetical protein